ncbi:MAG: PP2C family protein-serine/threonine phosphatase [Streptomyces sp.]|uniref:PP2C family protein-serine/threonine phosphatase n=1 Tax=Streptomyces sp. TaxID=1931 RepID=UPI003D6A087D
MPQRFVDICQSVRASQTTVLASIALMAVIVVVNVLAPPYIYLAPLLVAGPAFTAAFAGPWPTGLVAVVAVAAQAIIAVVRDRTELFSANHQAQIVALVLLGASLVVICVLRERRGRELRQVRYVSETAQRLVLRPLPEEIGPLRVASIYLAAEAEAQIGGDLYAAARTDSSTRLIIGDVRGKGMPTVGDAALLLGAFRAAGQRRPLVELAAFLDECVSWNLAEPDESDQADETFITAAILDIPDEGGRADMIDCGHPPPIMVRNGHVTLIAAHPATPLGLGELAPPVYRVDEFRFEVGDLLLLYTDGVIEARDSNGAFYPLTERVMGWTDCHPDAFLQRLRRDLLDHVGGQLGDDAAVIAIERLPAPARSVSGAVDD